MKKENRLSCLILLLTLWLVGCAVPTPSQIPPTPTRAVTAVPTVAITYYPIIEKPWNRIPTVVIAASGNDPRIPLVGQAVDFWNGQLKAIGSPFHLGPVVKTDMQIPDADLVAIGSPGSPGKLSPAAVALMQKMPGDLIIDLSNASFVSITYGDGSKKLIGIQAHPGGQDSEVITMNVIAHEIGHSIGLGHNSDAATLMCGRPAACRPGVDQFVDLQGFAPVTDEEKAYLLKLYPPGWAPSQ